MCVCMHKLRVLYHAVRMQVLVNADEALADTSTNLRVLNELKAALRTQPIR